MAKIVKIKLEDPLIKQHPTLNSLDYYSKGGKLIKDENFITLGFQDDRAVVEQIPLINIGDLKTKLSGQINIVRPLTCKLPPKRKFIQLNGKNLVIVPQDRIPQKVKSIVRLNPHSLDSKCLLNNVVPLKLKMFKSSSADKNIMQTNTDKGWSKIGEIKLNTVNSPVIQVQGTAERRVIPNSDGKYSYISSEEFQELSELRLLPAIFSISEKLLSTKNLEVLNKMQALNLSMKKDQERQDKGIQTNVNFLVDKGVQTDPSPSPKLSPYNIDSFELYNIIENSNDSPIIRDVNIGFGPSIGNVSHRENDFVYHSNFALNGKKEVNMTETTMKQRMFFNDLRECLNYNSDGNLPIHEGVINNNANLVHRHCVALKARKCDVNIENHNGCTPLQLAVINNSAEPIILVLLDFDADIIEADGEGNNILHLCVKFERLHILETVLGHAAFKSNPSCINAFNFEGLTPLMLCCISSWTQGGKLLIHWGSDVNIRDQTSGRTALFHAAEAQNVQIVIELLDHQADPKIKNFFGTSPHDAMYELDDMPEKIKSLIFGRSKKRSLEAEMNPTRTAKAVKTIKTFAKLKKIEPKPAIPPSKAPNNNMARQVEYVRSLMQVK